jgi:hypothetical protein
MCLQDRWLDISLCPVHHPAVLYIKILVVALIMSLPLDAYAEQPQWQPVVPTTHGRSAKTMVHGDLGDSKRVTRVTSNGRTRNVPMPVAICAVAVSEGQRVGWLSSRKCIVPAGGHFTAKAILATKDYFTLDYSNKLIWQPHKPGQPFPKNTVLGTGVAKVRPCLARVKHRPWFVKGKRQRHRSETPGYIQSSGSKVRCWYVEVGTDKVRSTDNYKLLLHYKSVPKG